jgi:hypothetical protein
MSRRRWRASRRMIGPARGCGAREDAEDGPGRTRSVGEEDGPGSIRTVGEEDGSGTTRTVEKEEGQALVLLIGLVVLVLMVLALGWDTSNWFLGHRALGNLADGAAVAAANDVDTRAWYMSGGRSVQVAQERARATVTAYLAGSAGDSGVRGCGCGRCRWSQARVVRR